LVSNVAEQAGSDPTLTAPDRDAAIRALAEKPAPRYTSYPTALQFSASVGPDTHRQWLSAVGDCRPVSVYVHVPYCRRLCWYCGCSTQATARAEPVAAYADTLFSEIRLVSQKIGRRLPLSSVHLGGGSPDTLAPQSLDRLFAVLTECFAFEGGAEIAAELDPSNVREVWVLAAQRRGLSRVSLGVQTFAPHVQAAINRPQSFEVVRLACALLRGAGVGSVNFDLMYGLPMQRTVDVRETLDAALTLKPDRIAIFGYAHVPWAKPHQRLILPADLPSAAQRMEQSGTAEARLVAEGYVPIGLDHFALPGDPLAQAFAQGRLHRNFQGYTADQAETLIGFGASAISRLPQGYAQNAAETRQWARALADGELPTARGYALEGEDGFRAEIIQQLMCYGRADLALICERWGVSATSLEAERRKLDAFRAMGLVAFDDQSVRLTEHGRPLVRTVCTAFDRYFQDGPARHSRAI
jgi:oxygen-independent coproporphyrinogen-3 oxidase